MLWNNVQYLLRTALILSTLQINISSFIYAEKLADNYA